MRAMSDNKKLGISMRFLKDYEIVVDPDPHAYSAIVCPDCGEGFSGTGRSLRESMNAAQAKLAMHDCLVKQFRQ